MNIMDTFFDSQVPVKLKQHFVAMVASFGVDDPYMKLLVPTASNDDVNGSQHASNGGNDFTYQDATIDDILNAKSAGIYDYFSKCRLGYTGHYYQGSDAKFQAIVLNPPAYAATYRF